MEMIKTLSDPIIKHGVLGIVLVEKYNNPFDQKYLLVQDYNDRGRGDGRRMIGLPGGGIEKGETPQQSLIRELKEEVALDLKKSSFKQFGCYQKLRLSGFINDNYLFVIRLKYAPKLETNDPKEVSRVIILRFIEIISFYTKNLVHEGSMRLIIHYLNGVKSGSLNEPAILNGLIKF